MMNNPFDITKAVDYTDAEIYKYWVDLSGGDQGFEEGVIKPNTVMPMIIVGSKGSGKTHIMKYFSYELQKIRCIAQNTSMQEGLSKEKFIGVYIRCSGFNSDKFTGKGVNNEVWSLLHAYFWELWVGERLVNILIDLRNNGLLDESSESDLVADILQLFLKCEEKITTFEGLNEYLLFLQKNVDYQVHNFIFLGQDKPMVDILLPPTRLTYEIPTLLKTKVPFFKDKYILYLIDELENFSAEQQQLIQTLIREKPAACTFRVGTRPYGIRTLRTLRGVEENHDGAEFEGVILDEFLRSYQHYPEYITKILENRLQNSGLSLLRGCKLEDLFEVQNNGDILRLVGKKKESQSRSYMQTLKTRLEHAHLKEDVIDEIIDRLPRLINCILVVLLILITFILSYFKLYTGIMWFVTAPIGTVAVLIISMMINHNRILEYLGMISLTVLCIHGPIYRILIKLISMLLNMNTDAVRESLILAFVVTGLTLCLCAIAHQIINRFVPWMIGKNRTDKV